MSRQGQVLAGKYRLASELGRGGMGSVWRAENLTLHSQVALKLIESTHPQGENGAAQFLREARIAAGLNSQHVVKIFDYGVAEDTPFIAMELLDGETLRRRLQRLGRLSLEELQKVVRQVSYGIERAHGAGIVHRDLKPENVFIVAGDESDLIKVLDFGIAKTTTTSLTDSIAPATPTGAVLGTPHYMSPEQAMGSRDLDHRTDLWSLGVLAFESLVGHPPFRGETLGALIVAVCSQPLPVPSQQGAVPDGFDAWFARACAREPAQRFASARELSNALAGLRPSAGQSMTLASATAPASEPRRSAAPGATRTGRAAPLDATARLSATAEEPSRLGRARGSASATPLETTLSAVELARGGAWAQRWKVASVSLLLVIGGTVAVWALRSAEHRAEPSAAGGEARSNPPSASVTPALDRATAPGLPTSAPPPEPAPSPRIAPAPSTAQPSPAAAATPASPPPVPVEKVPPRPVERTTTAKARPARAVAPAAESDAKSAASAGGVRGSGAERKPAPADPYQLGF